MTAVPTTGVTFAETRTTQRRADEERIREWAMIFVNMAYAFAAFTFALHFPSLSTIPLLLESFSWSIPTQQLKKVSVACFEACLNRLARCCRCCRCFRCCRRSESSDGCRLCKCFPSDATTHILWYSATLFLVVYLFNVIVTGPLYEVIPRINLHDRWFRLGGLELYRDGEGMTAWSLGEQALIVFVMASLEVMKRILRGSRLPASGSTHYRMLADLLQRGCVLLQAVNQPETSMFMILGFICAMLACEGGEASFLTITYVVLLLVIIAVRRESVKKQRFLWLCFHAIAEVTSIFVLVLYVIYDAIGDTDEYTEYALSISSCTELHLLMLPHVGVFATAGVQYLCLSEDSMMRSAQTLNFSKKLKWHAISKMGLKQVKTVRKFLTKFFEECMFLFVMNLSVVTALMPPVDIHSLALLILVGPSLLLHNMERPPHWWCCRVQTREWHELLALRVTQYMSSLFVLSRTLTTSKLAPIPDHDFKYMTLEELGVVKEMSEIPAKYLLLGVTAITARLSADLLSDAMSKELNPSSDDGLETVLQGGLDVPDERNGSPLANITPSARIAEPNEDAGAVVLPEPMQVTVTIDDDVIELEPSPSEGELLAEETEGTEATPPKVDRSRSSSRIEERLLERWAPAWMPKQAHSYLSILLLFVSFIVSDNENHLLNFLMILAVVLLCGWHKQWVRAGDVFALTTVVIMIFQYAFRFQSWRNFMEEDWIDQIGLRWTSNQLVRHYCILALCFLQKDLYYRGRHSRVREPTCPPWLARHADIVGIFVLLLVAVARRHSWAAVMAVVVAPWLIVEEASYKRVKNSEAWGKSRMTWLCFFRFVLLAVLLFQLVVRLGIAFEAETYLDPIIERVCVEMWEKDRLESCRSEWHKWTKITISGNDQLFWDFLALFMLGYVQQLLTHVEHEDTADEVPAWKRHKWKLHVMYWWPSVVWLPPFILSMEGGNLLGISNLVCLMGLGFTSDSPLDKRKRWVWRARLVCYVFLVLGLFAQSPGLPCSVASCSAKRHDTFIPHAQCAALEAYDSETVETEAQMRECEDGGEAWGHDTPATLMLRIAGMRRITAEGFGGGFEVIFGSQLGWLLLGIFATTIQLRIYSSPDYGEDIEEKFLSESEDIRFLRALRLVHEYHCRGALEKQAQQQRHRALRSKLKRIMKRVNAILKSNAGLSMESLQTGSSMASTTPSSPTAYETDSNASSASGINYRQFTERSMIAIEEVQLSHGVTKNIADNVTCLFHDDVPLSNHYLYILDKVAIGRIQPEGEFLKRLTWDLANRLQAKLDEKALQMARERILTVVDEAPKEKPSRRAQLRSAIASAGARIRLEWGRFKCSPYLAGMMWDHVWLGCVEHEFRLKGADEIEKEELHEHREHNGVLRIFWKLLLSNSLHLTAAASVMAFIETRCVLDFLRVLAVFFVALRVHPCPPREYWTALKISSAAILLLRTLYNFPIFCAGFGARTLMSDSERESSYAWEPEHVFDWCPTVIAASVDLVIGITKRVGPSSFTSSSWFWVVWADHLTLWVILLHEWMLTRSGLWEYVTVEAQTKQLVLRRHAMDRLDKRQAGKSGDESQANQMHRRSRRRVALPLHAGGGVAGTMGGTGAHWPHQRPNIANVALQLKQNASRSGPDFGLDDDDPPSQPHMLGNSPHRSRSGGLSSSHDLTEFGSFRLATHQELVKFYFVRSKAFVRNADDWMCRQREAQEAAEKLEAAAAAAAAAASDEEDGDGDSLDRESGDVDSLEEAGMDKENGEHGVPPTQGPGSNASSSSTIGFHSLSNLSHLFGSHSSHSLIFSPRGAAMSRFFAGRIKGVIRNGRHYTLQHFLNEHYTPAEKEQRVAAALKIQQRFRYTLRRRQQYSKIRCSMGHHLEQFQSLGFKGNGDGEICERCYRTMHLGAGEDVEWWACPICEYYACKSCVDNMLSRGLSVGATKEVDSGYRRHGVSLYWFKFCCGLFLLVYSMITSDVLVQDERSFSESVQNSSFGWKTILLLVLHLYLLISDRIWHKLYYRCLNSKSASRIALEWVSLIQHFVLFVLVHAFLISSLDSSANTRDLDLPLRNSPIICIYYIAWVFYFAACSAQERHGLPALDTDLLRPSTDPEQQGFITEKLRTFYFVVHYHLPFVDDLRVIIDWAVVRTSLDLWMYFKVEDAHSFLFRTRHVMFVRRQSFFAEERNCVEKLFQGWCLLLLLLCVILAPIIIFSPFTPFTNSLPVTSATVTIGMQIGSACTGESLSCELFEVDLFQSSAQRYFEWDDEDDQEWYFSANPSAATDIDIQEVIWSAYSADVFSVTPPVALSVARLLDTLEANGLPVVVQVYMHLLVEQESASSSITVSSGQCASSHSNAGSHEWPNGLSACGQDLETFNSTRAWWLAHAFGTEVEAGPLIFNNFWAPSIKIWTEGTYTILQRATYQSKDGELEPTRFNLNYTVVTSKDLCEEALNVNISKYAESWCNSGVQFGSLTAPVNESLRILFETEKGAQVSDSSTTFGSVIGLYAGLVYVVGRYLRTAFQDSSKRAIYEEIPDVGVFLDLVTAIQLAREHGDLRTEFQLYYELMKVLRSTDLLLTSGGHEVTEYGVFRTDNCPAECIEPGQWRNPSLRTNNRSLRSFEQVSL